MPGVEKLALKMFSEPELNALVDHIAYDPLGHPAITRSGGFRKARFAKSGSGKSSGARVIYWYFDDETPIFLITVFGKNEKDNLSKSEVNELAKVSEHLKIKARSWRERFK